jgi:hypothetical protein
MGVEIGTRVGLTTLNNGATYREPKSFISNVYKKRGGLKKELSEDVAQSIFDPISGQP